jgi:hypothetical protein
VHLAGDPGQVGWVLQPIVDAVPVQVGDVHALLPRLLLQVLPELLPLLGRESGEGLLRRLLVLLRRQPRGHLLVALRRLLVGDPGPRRPVVVAPHEVLVRLLRLRLRLLPTRSTAEQTLQPREQSHRVLLVSASIATGLRLR